MEKEIRSIKAEFRLNEKPEGRTISGYAVRFNEQSRYIGFYETISPEAITQDVINRSDVFMTYNHSTDNFLARSRNGFGTLHLELREDGLYFEFDCPDTAFGNDVLTKIRRGELDECSFAFTLSQDEGADVWEKMDNEYHRTIMKIDRLFDCAICPVGAYETTSVTSRSLEMMEKLEKNEENKFTILDTEEKRSDSEISNSDIEEKRSDSEITILDNMDEKELRAEEQAEKLEEQEEVKNEEQEEEKPAEEEQKSVEEEQEEQPEEKDEAEDKKEETEEEEKEEKSLETNTETNKNTNHNIMNKNFSLTRAIRNVVEKRSQDEVSAAVISAGKEELRKSGVDYAGGQIAIPMETRTVQVTGESGTHDAVIDTDFLSIQEPLKSKNILNDLGVNVLTGLVNDIQIPYGSAIQSNWVGEVAKKDASDATFTYKTMKPKRLSTVVKVSMQQLRQDSIGVENFLRKQIVESIQDKLESTIFSSTSASDNNPAGILATGNSTAGTADVENFKGLTMNEALIEAANYNGGAIKYAATPKAKAALRAMSYGGKSTAMVLQANEVDGTPLITSTHVGSTGEYLVGDWSTVYVGQWGPVLLQVDDVTLADEGVIRLIINSFWDVCYTRPEAIVSANVSLS